MEYNEYTVINYNSSSPLRKVNHLNHIQHLDKVLLWLIAILGICGSSYVFYISSVQSGGPKETAATLAAINAEKYQYNEIAGLGKFKDYVKIKGDKKVGEELQFILKKDKNKTRYVLDLGNGERLIFTGNQIPYTFRKSGEYNMELKTINRGLISTIATKEIKIKD